MVTDHLETRLPSLLNISGGVPVKELMVILMFA